MTHHQDHNGTVRRPGPSPEVERLREEHRQRKAEAARLVAQLEVADLQRDRWRWGKFAT